MMPWLNMPLDAKKNEPTPHSSIAKCQSCGLAHLASIPSEEEIPSLYDLGAYYTHGQNHMPHVDPSVADKLLTRIAWAFDKSDPFDVHRIARSLRPGARVCDVGSGGGFYLGHFKKLGFEVLGIDPDARARDEGASAGIPIIEGSAEALPDIGEFDLVLCTHALEHCRDAKAAIAGILSLTRPGGLAYIEVPNCAAEHFRTFTICSEMFDAPRHVWFFTPASLSRMVERAGFSVRKRLFMHYVRDFSPSWRAWETKIADRLRQLNPDRSPTRHTFAASVQLFLRSFWRKPELKYDSFGLILTR
jgi:SAM-dependent methyltransferase